MKRIVMMKCMHGLENRAVTNPYPYHAGSIDRMRHQKAILDDTYFFDVRLINTVGILILTIDIT